MTFCYIFSRQKYLSVQDRQELAAKLNLTGELLVLISLILLLPWFVVWPLMTGFPKLYIGGYYVCRALAVCMAIRANKSALSREHECSTQHTHVTETTTQSKAHHACFVSTTSSLAISGLLRGDIIVCVRASAFRMCSV